MAVLETEKKRVLYYLIPKENSFQFSISFGNKAKEIVLGENVSEVIKSGLKNAGVYAEGTGISLVIEDDSLVSDLFTLMKIKAES